MVLLLAALWIVLIPLLNRTLEYDDPIERGDRLLIAPGITFEPTPGWNLEAGLRTTDKTRTKAPGAPVTLTQGAVTMQVTAGPFDGTPDELLSTIEHTSISDHGEALNATGEKTALPVRGSRSKGVAEHYSAPESEGVVGAFVFGKTGVRLSVVGPAAQMDDEAEEIGTMLASFRYDQSASKGGDK